MTNSQAHNLWKVITVIIDAYPGGPYQRFSVPQTDRLIADPAALHQRHTSILDSQATFGQSATGDGETWSNFVSAQSGFCSVEQWRPGICGDRIKINGSRSEKREGSVICWATETRAKLGQELMVGTKNRTMVAWKLSATQSQSPVMGSFVIVTTLLSLLVTSATGWPLYPSETCE